jgi:hypothetical protein
MVEHGAMFCDMAMVETLSACLVACLDDTSSGYVGGEAMDDATEIARALGGISGAVSEVRTLKNAIPLREGKESHEYNVKVFISHIEVEKLAHKRVEETECGEIDVYLYSNAGIRRNVFNDIMQSLTN